MNTSQPTPKDTAAPGSVQPAGSAAVDRVEITREGKVWHVTLDGVHAPQCCAVGLRNTVWLLWEHMLKQNDKSSPTAADGNGGAEDKR